MLGSEREREPAYMLWIPGTGSLCTCSIHPGASNLPTASCLHSERPTVPHHRHHKVVALRNMVCGGADLLTRYNKEPFLQDKSQFSSLLTTRALLPTGSLLNTASLRTNASLSPARLLRRIGSPLTVGFWHTDRDDTCRIVLKYLQLHRSDSRV